MDALYDILADFKRNRLNSLYTHLYPLLLLYASRNLGTKYGFLAEDCVQNAVFSAWQKRHDFKSIFALRSYLYVSIRNQAVSILRKDGASNRYINTLEGNTEFENSVIEQETLTILYEAIRSMPEKYSRILQLSYFEGKRICEIAQELNVSESTIKKNKAAAMDMLRRRLAITYGEVIALVMITTMQSL